MSTKPRFKELSKVNPQPQPPPPQRHHVLTRKECKKLCDPKTSAGVRIARWQIPENGDLSKGLIS